MTKFIFGFALMVNCLFFLNVQAEEESWEIPLVREQIQNGKILVYGFQRLGGGNQIRTIIPFDHLDTEKQDCSEAIEQSIQFFSDSHTSWASYLKVKKIIEDHRSKLPGQFIYVGDIMNWYSIHCL